MNDDQLRAVESLFHAAMERPEHERAAYLAQAAAGDEEVRARVESMLAAVEDDSLLRPAFFDFEASDAEEPGATIGRYKLLQRIGEGGFGVVYMAEQREPVLRKVALKIIKLGMDTKEVVARFEAERQALALMDHPNIATVLDAGATSSGRPYFVMELVRGIAITEYCARNHVSTNERLEIFESICHAVQHAHSKGVIHRDLKPSNVLVTDHDTGPMPKIIDFGIAKAIHTPLTEKTLFTNFRHFIGTPQYMSPEQASMSALDVDTRSDIYSLGVLLYELLTGTTPLEGAALLEKGLDEMKRVVREEEPPRPSQRLSTSRDAVFARGQGTDVEALARRVRGDLDWIVLRALAKDRSRRYATAHELAADVRRHLEGLPVLAGPPTAAYRLKKLVARNRAAVLSGVLVALSLIAGIVGTSLAMIEASRQRDEAVAATHRALVSRNEADAAKQEEARLRALAQQQLEGHRRLTDFLDQTIAQADPETARDPEHSVVRLLKRASARIGGAFADDPVGEMKIRRTIGHAFNSLGELELAARHLRRACDIAEGMVGADPIEHYKTLWTLTGISFRLDRPDSFAMVAWAFRVGYAHIRREHPLLADALESLSRRFERAAHEARNAEAEPLRRALRETYDLADRTLEPGDERWPIVADTFMATGYTIWHTTIEPESERCFELALKIRRRELSPGHPDLAETVSLLAGVLSRSGRAAEAEQRIRENIELCRSIYPEGAWQTAFAASMLGECLTGQGRYAEAEEQLLAADEDLRRVWGAHQFYAMDSAKRIVELYDSWGRPEKARPFRDLLARGLAASLYVAPWAVSKPVFGPPDSSLRRALARIDALCGDAWGAYDDHVDPADVAPLVEALLAAHGEELLDGSARAAVAGRYLVHWTKRLDADAAAILRARMAANAVRILDACGEGFQLEMAQAEAILSDAADRAGDDDGSTRHAANALRLLRADESPASWVDALARIHVATVLFPQESYEDLEKLLSGSHGLLVELFGPRNADAAAARKLLARLYHEWDRPEEAARFR